LQVDVDAVVLENVGRDDVVTFAGGLTLKSSSGSRLAP
jgi:hypothetical protein